MAADAIVVEATPGVAVAGGRILAVGPPDDLVREHRARATRIVEGGGVLVLPGFHDAHTHLAEGSADLAGLDLRGAGRALDVARRLEEASRGLAPGAWIRGFGWSVVPEPPATAAAPSNPAFLSRSDGHAAWINEAARRELRLRSAGVVEEAAMDAARERLPPLSPRVREEGLACALARAAGLGLTSAEDVVTGESVELYARLRDSGRLPLRVGLWLPLEMDEDEAASWASRFPPDDPWVAVRARKVFVDGTLGGRTAALGAPYADAPAGLGELRIDPEDLARRVRRADEAGWPVVFHAVGDRAVAVALDAVASLPPRARPRPHRLEHVQVVTRLDLRRAASLPVAFSMQPAHFAADLPILASRLGGRRDVLLYPWRSVLEARIPLAFGSDWPVGPLDPLAALAAATRRPAAPGEAGEALDLEAALAALTAGPAAAAGLARDRGSLRPGLRADLVLVEGGEGALRAAVDGGRTARVRRLVDGSPDAV